MSGLKFKLKDSSNLNNDNQQNGEVNSLPKVKQQKKKRGNRFFYKVSNHHELFKIGRSFYSDYRVGVKSFAITSTGYQTSQQKTILGLASFFDHKEELKICIISDNLVQGAFKDIVSISKKVHYDFWGKEKSILIHSFYNHFEFIDLNKLMDLAADKSLGEFDEIYDHIMDMYDVVFWDVPELHKIQINSEKYFPVIMKYESISIIVAQSISKKDDIEEIKRFFLGYGINLKGLLLEERTSSNTESKKDSEAATKSGDKKPWWKKVFKS